MNFKKNIFALLFLNCCLIASLNAFIPNDDEDQELDEFTFDAPDTEGAATARAMLPIFAEFALSNIVPPQDVLLIPLYKSTKPVRRRSILDNELFHHDFYYSSTPFTVTPFVNLTNQACLLSNDTTIKNYLDIRQGDIPEKIEEIIVDLMASNDPGVGNQTVTTFSNLDIPDVLELFRNIKVQEKQIGALLAYTYETEELWKWDIRVPFIWQIYNFYLTQAEQDSIENQPLMKLVGAVDDFMPFAKDHLISDKIGIGDTQVRFELQIMERPTSTWSLGCSLGIPTAFSFKKGMYGSYFQKRTSLPDFNLSRDIVSLLENNINDIEGVKQHGVNLALAALDHLSSVLLDHPLGRDGHWTLGAYYKSTLDFTPQLQLASTAGILCPLPGTEDRFIKTTITQAEVTALLALPRGTDQEATIVLNKYNEFLLRKLFPQSYNCSIFPGIIFMSNSCLTFTNEKWALSVGSDMWCQTREHLLNIDVEKNILATLDYSSILNEYAFQSNSYVRAQYHNFDSSWFYTFTAGATGITDRIGQNISIVINIQRDF